MLGRVCNIIVIPKWIPTRSHIWYNILSLRDRVFVFPWHVSLIFIRRKHEKYVNIHPWNENKALLIRILGMLGNLVPMAYSPHSKMLVFMELRKEIWTSISNTSIYNIGIFQYSNKPILQKCSSKCKNSLQTENKLRFHHLLFHIYVLWLHHSCS